MLTILSNISTNIFLFFLQAHLHFIQLHKILNDKKYLRADIRRNIVTKLRQNLGSFPEQTMISLLIEDEPAETIGHGENMFCNLKYFPTER